MNIWRNLCVVAMLVVVSFLGGCAKDAPVEAKAGDKLPEIILVDQHNQPFNLNNATERAPIVLIYYRGGWCPYCNTHLSELRKIELQIKKKGYLLFAVSPDSPKELAKSTAKHKMGYTLLSDSKMTGAQALGIALKVDDETIMKYKGYGIDLTTTYYRNLLCLLLNVGVLLSLPM